MNALERIHVKYKKENPIIRFDFSKGFQIEIGRIMPRDVGPVLPRFMLSIYPPNTAPYRKPIIGRLYAGYIGIMWNTILTLTLWIHKPEGIYKVRSRNWNGNKWAQRLLNLTPGIEPYYFTGKYGFNTKSVFIAWLIWLYWMILRPISGGWTFIEYPNSNANYSKYLSIYR